MSADFKSHVLRRDEKGFGGVPFKRLLLGGVGGGFAYTVCRLFAPGAAIPLGVVLAILLIVLTSPRGGLPLWMRLWLGWRGSILLTAAAHPRGLAAEVARLLTLPLEGARLDGGSVFAPPAGLVEVDLAEWVTFVRARDVDRGDALVFVASPLEEAHE